MPSSFRRKALRQCLGADRKVSTFRWIARQTVGVCRFPRGAPKLAWVGREKAEDGAERSLRRCKRKRQRGQRRGKRRSRVGKTRSSSPRRPKLPKGVNARCINHSGRKFLWGERRRSQLVSSQHFRLVVKEVKRARLTEDDRVAISFFFRDERFEPWASHLRSLRRHARRSGIPDGANPFSESATDFLLTNTSLGGEMAFHDILGGLRSGQSPSEFHNSTVVRDEQEVDETPPSESAASAQQRRREENLSPGMRRFAPIVRPSVSGVVRPWERKGANNRQRRRP
jgi:hypothetical protein